GTNVSGSLLEDCLELDRGLVALSRNEVCLAERQPCGNVLRVNLEMAGKNCDGLSRLSVCQSGFGFREHAGSLRGLGPAGTWILLSGDCGQETQEWNSGSNQNSSPPLCFHSHRNTILRIPYSSQPRSGLREAIPTNSRELGRASTNSRQV